MYFRSINSYKFKLKIMFEKKNNNNINENIKNKQDNIRFNYTSNYIDKLNIIANKLIENHKII
jgi:alcohol dehydrogenase YqhD (iron-dependent ADH family)